MSNCSDLQLLMKYPLIIPVLKSDGTRNYTGRISLENFEDVELNITEITTNKNCNYRLKTQFGDKIDSDLNKLSCNNIVEFLDGIKSILSQYLSKNTVNLTNTYRKVLNEYTEFIRFHLNIKSSSISSNLEQINIKTIDDSGREHELQVEITTDDQYRPIFKPINIDLPQQFINELISTTWTNLSELYDKFLSILDILQPLFAILDEIDGSCSVLDPEKPTRMHCYRRIWLDGSVSAMLTIDPVNVVARPELIFLGPERLVEQYRRQLNTKLDQWRESGNFIENLLDVLGMDGFVQRPKGQQQHDEILMDMGECCICFAARCNDELPEIVCGNKSCENHFHVECLYEWLTSVNSKRIFNQIHGQCPNCEKAISCPLPKLKPVA